MLEWLEIAGEVAMCIIAALLFDMCAHYRVQLTYSSVRSGMGTPTFRTKPAVRHIALALAAALSALGANHVVPTSNGALLLLILLMVIWGVLMGVNSVQELRASAATETRSDGVI